MNAHIEYNKEIKMMKKKIMHYQPIWTFKSMFIFKPHNYIGWFPFHRNNQKIQQQKMKEEKKHRKVKHEQNDYVEETETLEQKW